ncbi:MAG: serine hydrolase [Caldisericia bacterium]|nr:serine hydrolase [Caldisericia bacterium]
MKKTVLLLIVCCICLTSCGQDKVNESIQVKKPIDIKKFSQKMNSSMKDYMDEYSVPGASMCMLDNGEIVLLKGYGVVKENGSRVNKETLFQIGTSTRMFTSALAALMVDFRQFEWNTVINKQLTSFELSDQWITNRMTVKDILTEQSGFYTQTGQYLPILGFSSQEIEGKLKNFVISNGFRSVYSAQNILRIPLVNLIEEAIGRPWQDVMIEEIFERSEMKNVSFGTKEFYSNPNSALPHYYSNDSSESQPYMANSHLLQIPETMKSSLGVSANIVDMEKWLEVILNDGKTKSGQEVLTQKTLNEMFQPKNNRGKGLFSDNAFSTLAGWVFEEVNSEKICWCTGSTYGYQSFFMILPDSKAGIALLMNVKDCPAWVNVAGEYVKYYTGCETTNYQEDNAPDNDVPIRLLADAKELLEYSGVYKNETYGSIPITVEDDRIWLSFGSTGVTQEITHYNGNVFYYKNKQIASERVYVSFIENEEGLIESCTIDFMKDTTDPFFDKHGI